MGWATQKGNPPRGLGVGVFKEEANVLGVLKKVLALVCVLPLAAVAKDRSYPADCWMLLSQHLREKISNQEALAGDKNLAPLLSKRKNSKEHLVRFLVGASDDLYDYTDPTERTPMHWAALRQDFDLLKELVRADMRVEVQDKTGRTPMHMAVLGSTGDDTVLVVLEFLKNEGARLDSVDMAGESPAFLAARRGLAGSLEKLLALGAASHLENNQQQNLALVAAGEGNKEALEVLYRRAPSMFHAVDISKSTPLHRAVKFENYENVKFILQYFPKLADRKDSLGNTPLHLAALYNKEDRVFELLWNHKKGSVRKTNKNGESVALLLVSNPVLRPQSLHWVFEGWDTRQVFKHSWDPHGFSLLHRLVRRADTAATAEFLDLLLKFATASDLKAQTKGEGDTLLHLAAEFNNAKALYKIAKILKERGLWEQIVNKTNKQRRTALHVASFYGHALIVRKLSHDGARKDLMDQDQKTPMDLARIKGHNNITRLLVN